MVGTPQNRIKIFKAKKYSSRIRPQLNNVKTLDRNKIQMNLKILKTQINNPKLSKS